VVRPASQQASKETTVSKPVTVKVNATSGWAAQEAVRQELVRQSIPFTAVSVGQSADQRHDDFVAIVVVKPAGPRSTWDVTVDQPHPDSKVAIDQSAGMGLR
jgi:hypothetical protein